MVSDAAARARTLIARSQNMVLATSDRGGVPWVTPLFYVADAGHSLLWTSAPDARHSENIRENAAVAIVIYADSPGARADAVYLEGEAHELSADADLAAAIATIARKPQPTRWRITAASDVSGTGPWRIYRARITAVSVRLLTTSGGRAVARRETVKLGQAWP